MDQYYFQEGYLETGYLTVVKEAAAGLTPYFVDGYLPSNYFNYEGNAYGGEFSLTALLTKAGEPVYSFGTFASVSTSTATATVIRNAEAAITATFTQTSSISHIEGADLFALSDAALTAAVHRLRDNNITASAVFSVATDVTRTRNNSSEEAAIFSFTAVNARSRDYASSQSAAFSLAASIDDRTRDQTSSLTSAVAFTATISHIEGADLTAFSNASLSATATRTKQFASEIASANSVTADVTRNPGIIKNLSSAFTQTAQANVTARITKTLSAVSTINYRSRPWELKKVGGQGRESIDTSVKKFGSGSLSVTAASGFNASSYGYVEYYTDGSLNYTFGSASNDLLIEFWIYNPTTADTSDFITYYSSSGVSWKVQNIGNTLGFVYYSNGFSRYLTTNYTLPTDQWNHIAIVIQGNGTNSIFVNGSRKVSTSSIGSPNGGGNILRIGKYDSTGTSFRIDELRILVGSHAGYSPTSTTLTVPTARFWNDDNASTKALFHFDIDYRDDIGRQQFADALTISSAATITANVDRIRFIEASASLAIEASTSVTGLRIKSSAVSLDSAFTQTANTDLSRTRDTSSNQSSLFTQLTSAVKTASIASDLNSQATFTATISHIHGADLFAFTNGTLSAIGVVTRSAISTQSSEFTQTANTNLSRIRFVSSAVTSAFTQSTTAEKTAEGSSAIASAASTSTSGDRIRFGVSNFVSTSNVSATVERVKAAAAALTSVFRTEQYYVDQDYFDSNYFGPVGISSSKTVSANIALIGFASELVEGRKSAIADPLYFDVFTDLTVNTRVYYSAGRALQAAFTTSTTARKSAVATAALASSSTLSATIDNRTRDQSSNLASAFSLTAQVNEYQGLAVLLSSEFTQTADNTRTRDFDSAVTSAASLTVTGRVTRTTSSSLTSTSSFTATISHILGADLVANNFATLTVDAFVGKVGEATLTSAFTQTATAERTRGVVSNQTSAVTVTAIPDDRTRNQSASLTTAVAVTATISHIEGADLVAFSSSTVTTSATKLVTSTITATSAVNFTASADKFRAFNANLAVSTSLSANALKLVTTQATLQAQAIIQANATKIVQFNITIASALTFVTTVREIDADSLTQFVYTIPKETWVYTIQDEVPVYDEILYVIPSENWTYTITQETREIVLEQETRIYNIRSS